MVGAVYAGLVGGGGGGTPPSSSINPVKDSRGGVWGGRSYREL